MPNSSGSYDTQWRQREPLVNDKSQKLYDFSCKTLPKLHFISRKLVIEFDKFLKLFCFTLNIIYDIVDITGSTFTKNV